MSRPAEPITACEHTDRRHYALGLCRSCWDRDNRRANRERSERIIRRLADLERIGAR